MYLLSIDQDGTRVKFTFNPQMKYEKMIVLHWECRDEWFAELLTRQCAEKLGDVMRQIREEEYNAGWKDAKSKKKPKRNWFSRFCGVR